MSLTTPWRLLWSAALLLPPPTVAHAQEETKKTLAITGYVTASYTYSTGNVGSSLVGRFYDRFHDQAAFNAAKVVLEMPPATDKLDAGFRADFLFGQNAAVTKSLGLNLGEHGDLIQGYAVVNVPLSSEGTYVQFKVGKMATLMGLEVIEDVVNPNLSVANQFIYLENFTNTGLRVDVKPSPSLDFQVAVINGWDVVEDNNTRKSFMGRLGIAATPTTTIGLLGFFGPEQPDATTNRYGAEVLLSQKLAGGRGAVYLQGDYGEDEELVGPDENAKWWGLGIWGTYDLTPDIGLALRGDYIDDKNGARTSGVLGFPANSGNKFGSVTATLNIKAIRGALIRPEIRYDRSNLDVYDDEDPSQGQISFGLGASYTF
ncbi:MAG TPA: outer membrane beta-barrel protein [Gemmatimonadales bacterium]|nr:outer membrane beta-barrel protein [Gemmatimonadales bacterium]